MRETRARPARKVDAARAFQFGKRFLTLYQHVSLSSSRVPHGCSQSKITCIRLASHPGVVNSTQSLHTKHTRLRLIFSFCSCLSFSWLIMTSFFFLLLLLLAPPSSLPSSSSSSPHPTSLSLSRSYQTHHRGHHNHVFASLSSISLASYSDNSVFVFFLHA